MLHFQPKRTVAFSKESRLQQSHAMWGILFGHAVFLRTFRVYVCVWVCVCVCVCVCVN